MLRYGVSPSHTELPVRPGDAKEGRLPCSHGGAAPPSFPQDGPHIGVMAAHCVYRGVAELAPVLALALGAAGEARRHRVQFDASGHRDLMKKSHNVVPRVLDAEDAARLREISSVLCVDADSATRGFPDLPGAVQPTAGRFHCDMTANYVRRWSRGCEVKGMERVLRDVIFTAERELRPVVSGYFRGMAHRLTQLQLLDAHPQSVDQFFHVDNAARGLTVLVALDKVTIEHGPTELLRGTEQVFSETGALDVGMLLALLARLRSVERVCGKLGTGDALLFDSRTLHRGRGNRAATRRPVLIIRYDPVDSPPPGIGTLGTAALRAFGAWLAEARATTEEYDREHP